MTRSARVTAWTMLDRYAEAAEELDTLLPECERVLGPDDHFTASNVRLKGIALQKLELSPQEAGAEAEPVAAASQPPAQAKSFDWRSPTKAPVHKPASARREAAAESERIEISPQPSAPGRSFNFYARAQGFMQKLTPGLKKKRVETGGAEAPPEPPASARGRSQGMLAFRRLEPDATEEAGEAPPVELSSELPPADASEFSVIHDDQEEIALHKLQRIEETEPVHTSPEPAPETPDARRRPGTLAPQGSEPAPKQHAPETEPVAFTPTLPPIYSHVRRGSRASKHDSKRLAAPKSADARRRFKVFASQRSKPAPKQQAREAEMVKFTPQSLPPIYSGIRRTPSRAKLDYKRLAMLAGAASLGVLAIGGAVIAATLALQESDRSSAPATLAEAPAPALRPAPAPTTLEQPVPEPAGSEDTSATVVETVETQMGLNIEQYTTSMRAGRHGAKVREAPSRDAPTIEHVRAGSDLRVTGRTEAAGHQWYRVALPDRRSGFVRDDVAAPDPTAIEDFTPPSLMRTGRAGANVRTAARMTAPLIMRLKSRSDLRITGRTRAADHTWYRIVLPDGREGFVRDDVVQRNP